MTIEIRQIYDQSCSASHLYSETLRSIRTFSIVQGITVITGAIYLISEEQYLASLGTTVFSIILTSILATLNYHYLRHIRCINKYIREIESEYSILANNKTIKEGPFLALDLMRDSSKNQDLIRFMLNKAIFLLLICASLLLLIFSIYKL